MFTVLSYGPEEMVLTTKHYSFTTPITDFKCLAGGLQNFLIPDETMEAFLEIVCPEQTQRAFSERIRSLLNNSYGNNNTDSDEPQYRTQ